MAKKYFLVENGKDLDNFKEEVFDLIVKNDKVVVEQHEFNKSGVLYEVKVGEEFTCDWNWWGRLSEEEKSKYLKEVLFEKV